MIADHVAVIHSPKTAEPNVVMPDMMNLLALIPELAPAVSALDAVRRTHVGYNSFSHNMMNPSHADFFFDSDYSLQEVSMISFTNYQLDSW